MNFPNPWPGGWWTLRGIVERQKVGAWALLDCVARNAETIVWDTYLKAIRQTERGAHGQAGGVRDLGDAARSAHAQQAGQRAAGPGHRGDAVGQGLHDAGRHRPTRRARSTSRSRSRRWASSATCSAKRTTRTTSGRGSRTARRSGPTTWARTSSRTTWASRPTRWMRRSRRTSRRWRRRSRRPARSTKGPAGYVIDGRLNDAFKAMNLLFDKNVALRRVDADRRRPARRATSSCPAAAPDAVLAEDREGDRRGLHPAQGGAEGRRTS